MKKASDKDTVKEQAFREICGILYDWLTSGKMSYLDYALCISPTPLGKAIRVLGAKE